jgi:hypothetical protein
MNVKKDAAAISAKKIYQSPTLRVYGDVTVITETANAGNGALTDGRGQSADRSR